MLSAYISYAREKILPKLSDDAARDLIDGYVGTCQCPALAWPGRFLNSLALSLLAMRRRNAQEQRQPADGCGDAASAREPHPPGK